MLSPFSLGRTSLPIQKDSRKIHEGYLYKKLQKTQRRYFVLYDDRTVDYFRNKSHASSRKNAEGTIHLTQIKRVEFVYCQKNGKHKVQRPRSSSLSVCSMIEPFFLNKTRKETYVPIKLVRSQSVAEIELEDYACTNVSNANVIKPPQINGWSFDDDAVISSITNKNVRSNTFTLDAIPAKSLSPVSEEDSDFGLLTPTTNMTPDSRKNSLSIASKTTLYSIDSSIYKPGHSEENEEEIVFNAILNDTQLRLKCYRNYSFALISGSRDWILSAENAKDAKDWILLFYQLCQGKKIYDGYLNEKYFVLHRNKVLNCYNHKYQIEQDIDLRHCLYIKYDERDTNIIQIGISNNDTSKQMICLKAANKPIASEWFHKIKALFGDNRSFQKLHHSKAQNVNIVHNESQLKHRFIAMYREYLVIFPNKKQFDSITRMTFFNKQIFGDMLRKEKCILIPLNEHTKIRKASKLHGKYAFLISDTEGDRKWYFTLASAQILSEWMNALCSKFRTLGIQQKKKKNAKKKKKKRTRTPRKPSIDLQIESSLTPSPKQEAAKNVPSAVEIDKFKYHILSSSYSESMNHLTILLTNDCTQIIA